jgi:mono/diheme cytochrome c family protein
MALLSQIILAAALLVDPPVPPASSDGITYSRDVAPILQQHCIACHRPGQIGPFSLTRFRDAANWAETIVEVVRDARMPPWNASPHYGRFVNDPRLSDHEKQTIFAWVQAGCPEGNPADLPAPRRFVDDWSIARPDLVVTMPQPFTVPADGVVEYQRFEVDPGFQEDIWIQAAEIRPGNRKVVHHCTVFLKPPNCDSAVEQGQLGSFCLAAMAPGTPPLVLPQGMAKLVPAGWRLVFVVHYAPIGIVQSDQTSIGLVFADPKTVKTEVATKVILDDNLSIPPGAADHRVEHAHRFDQDALLLAMFPHMHLRGKSFRYEAVFPDGTIEVLLDVPRYDFNWQHRYVLAEPKRLPAGTSLRCIAHYDNSSANPFNPDPTVTVHTGLQSWDEMFNGYFEWALADQDLTQQPSPASAFINFIRKTFQPLNLALALVPAAGLFLVLNRRRKNRLNA